MSVKEVLQIAREAAIKIRQREERAEIRRQSIGVQGHNSFEVHAKSGVLDPMRHVVELMDWQAEVAKEEDLTAPINEAYEIIAGAQHISDDVSIEIITRYYLQGESAREIVDGYERDGEKYPPLCERDQRIKDVPKHNRNSWLKKEMENVVSQWERIGIARLKEIGKQ